MTNLFGTYFWVPLLIIVSTFIAILSKKSNDVGGTWTYVMFLTGFLNVACWIIVTRVSKNLIFDSLLYDVVIAVVFTIVFILMGCGTKFTTIQWIGTVLALIGFILMRLDK